MSLAKQRALDDGEPHFVALSRDITDRVEAEERIQYHAMHDVLTGLPNRALLFELIRKAVLIARREQGLLCVIFMDLDKFKPVNDNFGHAVGDLLLKEVADRIQKSIRDSDTVARMGGDEFVILLPKIRMVEDALFVANKVAAAIRAPYVIEGHELNVSASFGLSHFPEHGDDIDQLLMHADQAMYAAKAAGRNRSCFFSKSLGDKVAMQLNLRSQIALGLQRGEFLVYLQPEMDFLTGDVIAMEALVRWEHPSRGLVSPNDFIPAAEESGLILELGEFVLCESLRMIRKLRDLGWTKLRVAVNVSSRQIASPVFLDTVLHRLHEQALPGEALVIEITESRPLSKTKNWVVTRLVEKAAAV